MELKSVVLLLMYTIASLTVQIPVCLLYILRL